MSFLTANNNKGLLYSRIAESIRKYISDENLQTGDKIPSERKLCEMLRVSRSSIREALRQMENQGVITVEPGRGSFVAKKENVSLLMRYVKENILQQIEVKSVLETQVIRHAVVNATQQQIEELDFIARCMAEISGGGVYPRDEDIRFHNVLSFCTPNAVMRSMVHQMSLSLINYWEEFYSKHWYSIKDFEVTMRDTIPFHIDIVQAIKEKDEGKAVAACRSIYNLDIIIYNQINTMG